MENKKLMSWVLRIAVAGEFIGHGLLAIQGKKDWIDWISQMTGADAGFAAQLLFWIGVIDVAMAILLLIKPVRLAILWMAFWAFWTALVRPLVGVGWLDFVERSANWGAPLALLLLIGWPRNWREWFK